LLDKTSIVRLAITTIRLNNALTMLLPPNGCVVERTGAHVLEALDGFALVLSTTGEVLYVSESVSVGLGLSQVEMIGNHLVDYVHVGDVSRFVTLCTHVTQPVNSK
jgi:hypothetical protein